MQTPVDTQENKNQSPPCGQQGEPWRALKSLFALVESGVLVRDTSHDNDPKWYLKAIELTEVLKSCQDVLGHNATLGSATTEERFRAFVEQEEKVL